MPNLKIAIRCLLFLLLVFVVFVGCCIFMGYKPCVGGSFRIE